MNNPSAGNGSHWELQRPAQPRESRSPETSGSSPSPSLAVNCQRKEIGSTQAKAPTRPQHPLGSPRADPAPVAPVPHHQHPAPPRGIMAAAAASPLTHGASPSAPAQPAWPRHRLRPGPHHVPPGPWGHRHGSGTRGRRQGWAPGRRDGQVGARWLLRSCRCGPPLLLSPLPLLPHALTTTGTRSLDRAQPRRSLPTAPASPWAKQGGQCPFSRVPLEPHSRGSGGRRMLPSPAPDHPPPSPTWLPPVLPPPPMGPIHPGPTRARTALPKGAGDFHRPTCSITPRRRSWLNIHPEGPGAGFPIPGSEPHLPLSGRPAVSVWR